MPQGVVRLQTAILLGVIAAATAWVPSAVGQARDPTKRAGANKPALKPGQIDVGKSRVYVWVGKKKLGHEHGVEGKIKAGSIDLKAAKNLGEVEFDVASFVADTDEARKHVDLEGSVDESTREKVTETMLGPSVLDVEQFPKATFKIKSQETKKDDDGGDTLVLKGDFTLHGKTRTITVQAQVETEEGQRVLRGEFKILQSDFGITPYKAALGVVGVADELRIIGEIVIAGEGVEKKKK
jgi:polyisoprenoid-binding protein YceI